jgi:broad specificity phosphatase PhoE
VSEAAPPIYFVRHGETDWNRQGLIQGWTDTTLNDLGHAQARAVASAFTAIQELASYDFYVSPLLRARQSMGHIVEALKLKYARIGIVPDARELGFGVWEGRPLKDLKASPDYPADGAGRYGWRPDGGESYADGFARIGGWLSALARPSVVVAHGAIGRCLLGKLGGLAPANIVSLNMPQGCYWRIADGRIDRFDAEVVAA